MTEILTKIVHNCDTGITEEIAMTAEEIAQHEIDKLAFATEKAERLAIEEALAALKSSAKAKLIAGQPLTAEEANTLVI